MNTKRWSFIGILLILAGFAGMAYQHFDFGGQLPTHQQKWAFESGALKTLLVGSDYDVKLEFIDSPDGTNYVEISGNMEQKTIDTLKATQISGDTLKLDLQDDFDWSFFSVNFQSTKQRITVALSDRSELNRIDYKSNSSNGTFRGLRAGNVDLSISSGNLRAENVTAGQLKLASTSGNITAENIQGNTEIKLTSGNIRIDKLEGVLTAKSTSGNITANQVQGNVQATVSSGNIRFERFTGDGSFKATSGNITLSEQRSDNLDIYVGSGNATLSTDAQFKGFYDLHTASGDTTAPDSLRQTQDLIKVRATSGNIRIR
ncbi:hypothetical protein J53TS2_11400 [Paenibacillus sp. J53TS2]|uniref:DUF4097 family beta strand repeat-containing protein n=1 Tax=Paenibacillus sp. J53TS2 TaxID=2807197 RepID=UPI001B282217|nr:DUF4097 family beta strand repeat-containing protein [Paenibacillus sp. J53TS2]GIP47549.1 hypothetical protein J53TS2_11400 [Paenibacillus sp. J53TS2]